MPWRGDDLNAETPHVPGERTEDIEIQFACRTTACGDLSNLQRLSAKLEEFPVGGPFRTIWLVVGDKLPARHGGKSELLSERDGFCMAGIGALRAEDAFPGIDGDRLVGSCDGVCRAEGNAGFAGVATICVDDGTPLETFRKLRFGSGETTCPVSLFESCEKCLKHDDHVLR